ncbi:MAG TPA: hypothetical protein VF184_07320 [Phycisphaeraceae bacterium]
MNEPRRMRSFRLEKDEPIFDKDATILQKVAVGLLVAILLPVVIALGIARSYIPQWMGWSSEPPAHQVQVDKEPASANPPASTK